MDTKDFISFLEKSNFSLAVEKGKLILKGDKKKLSTDEINAIRKNDFVINYIKEHKNELIEYVSFYQDPSSEKKSKDITSIYRLSGLQEGMLFHGLYDEKAGAYIEQLSCDLWRPDLEIIRKSWNYILNHHSILRSSFYYDAFNVPVQCVYRKAKLPVAVLDYRDMDKKKQSAAIKKYEEADRLKGFDVKTAPLMRVGLFRLSEDQFRMLWTSHHILFDGWSMSILMEEFLNIYELLVSGKEAPEQVEDCYEDYIRYIDRLDKDAQESYWRNYMKGIEQGTLLPFIGTTAYRTKGIGTYETLDLQLNEETTTQIESYVQRHRLTINSIMQGIWSYLLHQYTGQSDIAFGIIVSGRPDDFPEVEKRVGLYVNTIPLHSNLQKQKKIVQWLKELQQEQAVSRQYQYTPLKDIKGWTAIKGDLFDSLLVFQNYPVDEVLASKQWSLQVENIQMLEQTNYPLTILINIGEKTNISFSYNKAILNPEYVHLIRNHFENVLLQIISNDESIISDIELLTHSEQSKLLFEFNDTTVDYPENKTIIDLFEEQVLKTPGNTALVFEDKKLTYKELNERVNQLAHYLRSKGVKEEKLVPICIERSIDMITGILGILKAGGAYVPIDPEYPEERIRFMLEDTAGSIIISSEGTKKRIPLSKDVEIIEIEKDWSKISKHEKDNLPTKIEPDQLAHVIYTSGSTGRPKGVMIEHKNLYSFISWCREEFLSSRFEIVYASTSICFDLSVFEIFYPLSVGKPLRILENGLYLGKYLSVDSMVLTNSVPGVIENLLKEGIDLSNISIINMAGEPISLYVQQNLDTDNIEVRNLYGPTEDTTYTTIYRLKKGEPVIIGRPISNTSIYIVNSENNLVPMGVSGEITISGAGVTRGYLNRPELTAEKFIDNPFSHESKARIYKTGDLGRWLPDGNIEYLGRIDEQVKVRGYRIELGEIESVIHESELVNQCVVIAKEDGQGNKRLVVYFVAKDLFDKEIMMSYLQSRLPEYMVPYLWMELESLPLTQNGKINRKALPDPDASELLSNEYVAPRNELEEKLAEIWKELLHTDRVGIHDNFFELGGDSIITIQVVSRARRRGFELKPKDIFIYQTIGSLSVALTERSTALIIGEQGKLTGSIGLLPIQQWFFGGAGEEISHFNQSILLEIDKSVTAELFSRAVKELISHHDALRFRYYKEDGKWHQEYGTNTDGAFATIDLRAAEMDSLGSLIKEKADYYQRSLDIEKGELARFVLIQTPETDKQNRILIVIHHLAVDGVSWRILLDDIELLLTGFQKNEKPELGYKSSSYRQWYDILEQYSKSRRLLSQSSYWEEVTKNYHPLPSDKTYTGVVRSKDIETYVIRLDKVQTQLLLSKVPRAYHTEINDIFLCALAITFCELLTSEKVIIGLEGHGRENISDNIDTSRTVGWFTNLYPQLLEVPSGRNVSDKIKSVKEQLRRVPDKGLGYGVLKYINKDEKLSGRECWDIIFNYLGQLDNVNSGKWFSQARESRGDGRSKEKEIREKLSIDGSIQGEELILNWNYSSCHFEKSTIINYAQRFQSNLQSLILHCTEQEKKSGPFYTPSDYGLGSEIGYAELDKFLEEPFRGIPRRESLEGLYRLSGLQEGMLFHSLYDEKAGAYNEQFSSDLNSPDLEIITRSWNYVLRRHSILRSGFYYDVFDVPVQCVYRVVNLPVTILDYRAMDEEQQSLAIKEYESADRIKGFDFRSAPLMRLGLIRLSENRYRMIWTSHHILFDGWSMSILIEEFLSIYELLVSGKEVPEVKEDRYEDYIRYLERVDKDKQENYWRDYMKGVEQSTLLPFIRPTTQRTKGVGVYEKVFLKLDVETTAKAELYLQSHRLTMNTLMQGVWSYLLHNYTGNKDVVYGVIVSGRPDELPEVEQRVGLYINTLPLHSTMQKEQQLTQWLQNLQNNQVSSSQNQYTPLLEIQGWTEISGDLFDTLLVFENYPLSEIVKSKEWSLRVENNQMQEQTNYPLTVIITSAEQIYIEFRFNTGILNQEYVNEIRGHFENVLLQIITSTESNLSEIKLLTESEERRLLVEFNDTEVAYPKDKTIIDLFGKQVQNTPENIALVFEEHQLTYQELHERSNQLAHYLKSKGVKEETLVPVCMERSIDLITGILGILKAGGAYVPVDPEYPEERIRFIIEDTGAKVILSSRNSLAKLPDSEDVEIISLDDDRELIDKQKKGNLLSEVTTDNLAYVIYTSGSTGKPKGVMVEHSGVVNLVMWHNQRYEVTGKSRSTTMAGVGFDAFGWEVFPYLLSGATLYVIDDSKRLSPVELAAIFIKNKITHSFIATALAEEFINASGNKIKSLKCLLTGGDKLPAIETEGLGYKIVNNYGPTENTVVATCYELSEKDSYLIPPIGKPISNNRIYIVNKKDQLTPVGVAGEICISGSSLSRGYLNLPELTKEKFIKDPFSKETEARLYRTGDLGRWLADGNIEYLGRIDEQVKVRGFRIELGEIESVIQESDLVQQSVVVAKEDEQNKKRLVAYVVAKDGKDVFDKEALVLFLKSRLPEYMIPALWVEMESLPLTPNGKIDRKSLPDPDASELLSNEYVAPRNEQEEKLAQIWKDLLHAERVGINDNFFELGGDSIITIQVVSRARRVGYELKPKDIFIHQTIGSLSSAMAEHSAEAVTGEQGLLTGESGLLPIQQWYFEEAGESKGVSHFNQAVLLSIDKSITPQLLSRTVEELTAHHDALRFNYHKDKHGQWTQEYGTKKGKLITVDLRKEKKTQLKSLIKVQTNKFQRSLNIETGEIARFVLIQTPEKESKNRIFIVIHHLAVDGVSWRILLDDLELLLTGLQKNEKPELGYKSSSYRQWYEALTQYGRSKKLLSQSEYWEQTQSSYEPLPVDTEYKAAVSSKNIKTETMRLDSEQTQLLLQEVPRVYHTEINDILLCALAMTLSQWSDKEKVIIGMEGHGRESISESIDTSRTAGWFTSVYPVLIDLGKKTNLPDAIKSVKEQLRQIPDKGLGYGVLKYINKEEKLSGKECWDIVFNYIGQLDNVVSSGKWLSGAGESRGAGSNEKNTLSSNLSLNAMVQSGELILNWSYSSKHYKKGTIANLTEKYKSNLESLISHCTQQKKSGVVYTPSDYGLGEEISYNELDNFLEEPFRGKTRRESIEGLYRLSGLQEGMLFHGIYDDRAGAYTEQLSCELINPDLEIISKSWHYVLSCHSILRSCFYYDVFKIPVQCVYRNVEIPVTVLDYREMNHEQQFSAIKEYEETDRLRGFDFKSVPLMRIGLIRQSEDRYRMLWTSHHILFDGWSMPILMEEFLNTYESLVSGKDPIAREEDRYEDYIRYIERSNKEREEIYWRNYMNDVEQGTLLPFIASTTQRTKGVGAYETALLNLDTKTTAGIENFTQKHRITINTLMQGVWSYLLHHYTGNKDVLFGVIVSGRPDDLPGVEQRVGLFINTLPMHSKLQKESKIAQWLNEIQEQQTSSLIYQYTPLKQIQEWTGVTGDLFDSLLVFENYPISEIIDSKKWSLEVENMNMHEQTNYPLTILIENSEQINIKFSYNTELWDKVYIQEISDHFKNVLQQIIENEKSSLDEIKLLTKSEEHQILFEFNDTLMEFPEDKSVMEMFEEQVMKTPDSTAIIFEDQQLSYRELNERANQLAHYLRNKGADEGTIIPVCMERSSEMIIALLGIMKSGAAYLPIDPDYPPDLVKYILEDSKPSLILGDNKFTSWYNAEAEQEIICPESNGKIKDYPESNLSVNISPDRIICVMYTSGSSGLPKGVKIGTKGIANRICWMRKAYPFENNERCVLKTSLSFVDHIWELLGPLTEGVCSVLLKKSDILDPDVFINKLSSEKITRLVLVPSLLRILLDKLNSDKIKLDNLKYWICSGEALPYELVENFYSIFPRAHHKLLNIYGSTEVSADATFYETISDKETTSVVAGRNIPIGKPLANAKVYIVDADKNILPAGVIGEIWIGGVPVGEGYLNRPELTSEKFNDDPFSKEKEAKVFKTGDLGRWLPDGNIEYMGRKDFQVKIRGFRVELGEIENALQQCDLVSESVVMAKDDAEGNKRLIGYIVPKENFDKNEVILFLRSKLPEYMIPLLWMELESMPLNPNGKIDKRVLPDVDVSEGLSNEYVAPRNETEEKLAGIWKELLHLEHVGVEDNFFESGGHSLLAMRMISAIRKEFTAEVEIKDLFLNPTISGLAMKLENPGSRLILPGIDINDRPERIPLSFSQERMWFIDMLEGSLQYHMPAVLRLNGKLNIDALRYALQTIINRHEILRTVIQRDEDKVYQRIISSNEWNLSVTDGSVYKNDTSGLKNYIQQFINAPFDLSKDYKLRAELIRLSGEEHILTVAMHHIASDGWSISIIVNEMAELYDSYINNRDAELSPLNIQYSDYAVWQRKYLNEQILENILSYWKGKLDGVTALQLPTDHPRPAVQSIEGAVEEIIIDNELYEQLKKVSQQNGVTLFMTLLTVFKILLYRYSGQNDICVGTSISNRPQKEFEELIGFFVNMLALRNEVRGDTPFTDLLQQVKTTMLEAYEHQEAPFEKVVDAVVKERNMGRNPLFQVLFVLLNTPEIPELKLGDVTLTGESYEQSTAQFEINFLMTETSGRLQGTVSYRTDLYNKQTIQRMISHFKELLKSVVKSPHLEIELLKMLTKSEEQQLISDFNDTKTSYPKGKSVAELFEEQVKLNPDNIAVVFEEQQLTYDELNKHSNKLAHYLRSRGVNEGTFVPVCIRRSPELIIGILGILKAGAAYVPIDPDYPEERIDYMLKDITAKIFLISKDNKSKLPDVNDVSFIEFEQDSAEINKQTENKLQIDILSENPAYVIYTSGSTGQPKGVIVTQRNVVSLVKGVKYVSLNEDDILLSTGSSSFDASTFEYWSMLMNGGTLILCNEKRLLDIELLKEEIEKRKVTMMWFTSSWFNQIIDNDVSVISSLKTILAGGEKLSERHIKTVRQKYPDIEIINGYGPTENTTFSLTCNINETDISNFIPVGKPLSNRTAYILDKQNQLCPVGIPGEICVGGDGLSLGYLNRPELTSEKFITDPFKKEQRLYRTGDLGRWMPDGNIEYLGRMDDQVKIRGYRIEPGEIESVLLQSELVSQAVVLTREDNEGNKRLTGYIVPEEEYEQEAIETYIKSKLPEYMIPSMWVVLENLPLTANGKVDKNALPDPDPVEYLSNEYVAPRDEMEMQLAQIWEEVLEVEKVGIHDNFFELGGDSIIIIQIISRFRRSGYELQVADIFTYQTIAGISEVMKQRSETFSNVSAEQSYLTGPCGLLPIQQWYFENDHEAISHFNQSVLLGIDKTVTEPVLREAIEKLTAHHDALRFRYYHREGQWHQEYGTNKGELILVDLSSAQEDSLANAIKEQCEYYQRSLNIEKGEIAKFVLMQTHDSEVANRLLIVVHHLAIDGVSWRILFDDIEMLVSGLQNNVKSDLGHKTSSYRQWYETLEKYGHSENLLLQNRYWEQIVNKYQKLPVDKDYKSHVRSKDISNCVIRLDPEQTHLLLKEVPRAYHTEINDILLCALAMCLCEWSSTEKVIIGLEGHGRENIADGIDTSRTIGWFTNLYPVMLEITSGMGTAEAIKSVKEQIRKIPEKGLGYGVLKYINKDEKLSGKACWDIVFNYLGQLDNIVSKGRLFSLVPESAGMTRSEETVIGEKLSINGSVQAGELVLNWSYSKHHYEKDTMEKLIAKYKLILESLISHCIEQQKSGAVYTPSDYGLGSEVSFDELDIFLNERL